MSKNNGLELEKHVVSELNQFSPNSNIEVIYPVSKKLIASIEAIHFPSGIGIDNYSDYGLNSYNAVESDEYFSKADFRAIYKLRNKKYIQQMITMKSFKGESGSNQIQRWWIETLVEYYNLPKKFVPYLKMLTKEVQGEFSQVPYSIKREMQIWLLDNGYQMISDMIFGRGQLSATHLLICNTINNQRSYKIYDKELVMEAVTSGRVLFHPKSIDLFDCIGLQRKGSKKEGRAAYQLQAKLKMGILCQKLEKMNK